VENNDLQKEIEELRSKLAKAEKPKEKQIEIHPIYSLAESQARAQMEKLERRRIQIKTGTVNMISGNVEPSYKFPDWEQDLYHIRVTPHPPENANKTIRVEGGKVQQVTELETSVKKINKPMFERMSHKESQTFKAYLSVQILHDPTK
jgi:hypothetical protein